MSEWYAISVKQPWAGLIAAGAKSIEVRTWPTRRRGLILIHAARVPDARAEAWACVTTRELAKATEPRGGVIAVAELVDCIEYGTAVAFAADAARHRNPSDVFRGSPLYGFALAGVRPVPFFGVPGNRLFFPVPGYAVGT